MVSTLSCRLLVNLCRFKINLFHQFLRIKFLRNHLWITHSTCPYRSIPLICPSAAAVSSLNCIKQTHKILMDKNQSVTHCKASLYLKLRYNCFLTHSLVSSMGFSLQIWGVWDSHISGKGQFPLLRKKEIEGRKKHKKMAKGNNKRVISLNLMLMLFLAIFISMAESRILGGKLIIAQDTDKKDWMNFSHHYGHTSQFTQLFVLVLSKTEEYWVCFIIYWLLFLLILEWAIGTVAKKSTPLCDAVIGVESGDTCFDIADKFQLTTEFFDSINPNLNCDALFVGQWVCVDGSGSNKEWRRKSIIE